MTDRILQIIVDAIDDINTMREEKIPTDNVLDLCLYGNDGIFESMYLVAFLSQVEESLEDEFEVEVTLASEKAVSLRVSPFSSVRRLIAFIEEELQLVGADAA
ncbi:hypothetical protein RM572_19590 [Streptomyces sp. DSM 42041]|uniref:Carrier domain-containing protein n=1 Tax=Streptomyces hazeniae TaxID=3075538 RepID=A0ABU2NWU4_9ACTN|nr:hypothetical protein [Streptomyces sp. DSM 42041]MDT0380962.1 hypothetical protein [Streptomyces sp. DSM 42041]